MTEVFFKVHVYSGTRMCRLLQKTLNILDDLALFSGDNDHDMTFVGLIVYL